MEWGKYLAVGLIAVQIGAIHMRKLAGDAEEVTV